ncbi:hypothetical protein [Thalassospira alkalitolerans]|uniref:Uncharacterized protein n=1 Tax=Thalassospira alkalitolerans TaxID=1293890 RepID=A0A1Y2L7U5_9PROT|nr:hypothetical protein [Thalassospira alkalitolerans]OSQ44624.1 hypothetical protein TALK_18815 [Thalassospira alkalitolerans]
MSVARKHQERREFKGCPDCGKSLEVQTRKQTTDFGGANGVNVVSFIEPYVVCSACEMEFILIEGADNQHDAVCRALGRLTAVDILRVVRSFNGTREEFCNLIGVGEASLRRWIRRAAIQDDSNDRLLRLASIPSGVHELRKVKHQAELDMALGDVGIVLRANWKHGDRERAESQMKRFAL